MSRKVSDSTVRRLSLYLRILEGLAGPESTTVSSEELAGRAGTTAAQVRKDLSLFGSFGKRGLGYDVDQLADQLRGILGLGRGWRVALVGAGRIGSALFEYSGFAARGFEIVAVLDIDPEKIGRRWGKVTITDAGELERVVNEERVDIAIVAVPSEGVQDIVDTLVATGVRGILNFAPGRIQVPVGVTLKGVNLVMELEALSFALSRTPAQDRAAEGHAKDPAVASRARE